ncbi:hypothetical protein A2I96_13930 [Pseudoalteromonas tetraodonis]|uniref:Membrane protein triplicated sequence n=1 Tax=Pseudoalteromonas tetraodonis TaxID=43659 RepID=A0ABD4EQY9_9GAMM|nr:hypothetical protein A2I96_13930 [Pseudoalteromonas spiralis]
MYIDYSMVDYVSAFTQWGFLMAFLYSLVSSINKADKSLTYLAAIMFSSYFCSDFFPILENVYLDWILFDYITISIILILLNFCLKAPLASYYIILGLLINSLLTFFIYYDLFVRGNIDEWWLWSVYSLGVNFIDVLMIISLVINTSILKKRQVKKQLNLAIRNNPSNG